MLNLRFSAAAICVPLRTGGNETPFGGDVETLSTELNEQNRRHDETYF